ncbi:MAG: repeat protein [Chlorobi bacterium]|nr:repeat protein [Chlorobiota bacterium]
MMNVIQKTIREARSYLLRLSVLLMIGSAVHAQSGKVTANPAAQRLHEIWRLRGNSNDYVGLIAGPVGDINGDSLADFAVSIGWQGQVFLGASGKPQLAPIWTFDSLVGVISSPINGNFLGHGSRSLGFMKYETIVINGSSNYLSKLAIFSIDSGHISASPVAVLDPYRTPSRAQIFPKNLFVEDIDHDGIDDILFSMEGSRVNGINNDNPQIWIYRGGAGFPADTPTVIIKDTEPIGGAQFFYTAIGDFDHDGAIDILASGEYTVDHQQLQRLKFYFGSPDTPWDWSAPPRIITINDSIHPTTNGSVVTLDCDGDHIPDIWMPANDGKCYVFRSGTGKNPRTRSFTIDDADQSFSVLPSGFNAPVALGYLSDSSRHYQTGGIIGMSESGNVAMLAFNGGPNGPNTTYDASFDDGLDDIFVHVVPIGDCNGDGWEDILCSNPYYFTGSSGIAVILAGGPYIPRDSIAGVEDISTGEKQRAISLWPNPVTTELNIAWRGDLKRPPCRFIISDMLGREIASGDVDPSIGAALWRCDDAPAGALTLTIYDRDGRFIAAHRFIRQ